MVPWVIATDKRLSHGDVRIFLILAACRRGPNVNVGRRRIAKLIHVSRDTVKRALAKFERLGYLEFKPSARGKRGRYSLTSPLFSPAAVTPIAESSEWHSPAPPLVKCSRCSNQCRGLLKVGWCRACAWRDKGAAISREEIQKAAVKEPDGNREE